MCHSCRVSELAAGTMAAVVFVSVDRPGETAELWHVLFPAVLKVIVLSLQQQHAQTRRTITMLCVSFLVDWCVFFLGTQSREEMALWDSASRCRLRSR